MVFLGLVLVTVLKHVTHTNGVPAAQHYAPYHSCHESILCATKPVNYPQEEIDKAVIQNLNHLHRLKRENPEPVRSSYDGNCAVTDYNEMIKPFSILHEDGLPRLILQSKWFEQTIPKVTCKSEKDACFTSFTIGSAGVSTHCATKKLMSTLLVYDPTENKTEPITTEIDVDCFCALKYDDEY